MRILKKTRLLFFLVVLSNCVSSIKSENSFSIDEDFNRSSLVGNIFLIGDLPHTEERKDLDSVIVTVNNEDCWNYRLSSPIIPIPVFPLWKTPSKYSINVFPMLEDKSSANNYLSNIDITIVVDGVSYKGILDQRENSSLLLQKGGDFVFPIKCNSFNKASIILTNKNKNHNYTINIKRVSKKYYSWMFPR